MFGQKTIDALEAYIIALLCDDGLRERDKSAFQNFITESEAKDARGLFMYLWQLLEKRSVDVLENSKNDVISLLWDDKLKRYKE